MLRHSEVDTNRFKRPRHNDYSLTSAISVANSIRYNTCLLKIMCIKTVTNSRIILTTPLIGTNACIWAICAMNPRKGPVMQKLCHWVIISYEMILPVMISTFIVNDQSRTECHDGENQITVCNTNAVEMVCSKCLLSKSRRLTLWR